MRSSAERGPGLGVGGEKMPRENRNVLEPGPQRRHLDREHAETEVEIAPEEPLGDLGGEIPIGSRDEPYVGPSGPPVPHALERRVLQRPEELELQLGWDVSHLVEKQRAPLGLLDVPGPIAHGPGHGTADMPE